MCGITFFASLGGAGRDARAQVVQLPSVQAFGYSGSAMVPDSGQAYLGGVGGQRAGTITRGGGPMTGRASSSATGGTSLSASASIIDLQAMDAAILNEPTAKRPSNYTPRGVGTPIMNTLTPQLYSRRMGADQLPPPNDPNAWEIALGGGSVSKIGPANTIVRDNSDVRYFMLRAKEAYDAGRTAASLVYYRMAYERLTPQQRERLHEFQAKANAAAQATAATAAGATSSPPAAGSGLAAPVSSAPVSNAPATSAASSEAGAVPPAATENANPFDSPF